jgi:hypothetical protein
LIGKPRASVHRRSNSAPIPLASFTTGTRPRAIVGPPFMRWRNRSPAQGGWRCAPYRNTRDCRHGGYGQGTLLSRRRMSSRPEVTPGALESSGDQSAGIVTCRMADKGAAVSWLRENVLDQAVWALRITARNRYSDRCWGWGECLGIAMKALPTALEGARAV